MARASWARSYWQQGRSWGARKVKAPALEERHGFSRKPCRIASRDGREKWAPQGQSPRPCCRGRRHEVVFSCARGSLSMKPIPILRHVPHESAGTLEDALAAAGLQFRYVDLFQQIPSDADLDLTAAPGLVVMGGPMNVDETDKYPFLTAEIEWIRQALAARLPTLGICLGSQLLAKACGAKVFSNRVKEIGWYTSRVEAGGRGRPVVWRLPPVDRGLPMARRHVRSPRRRRPSGPKPLVQASGVPGRRLRLRTAIPHRNDRGDGGRLARRAGQLRRACRVGFH